VEFFQSIEQLAAIRLLRASFIAYPIVNALHIAAIGTLLTSVMLLDLSLLGAIRSLPRDRLVALFRRLALGAFAIAGLSGALLFSVKATDYVLMPVFQLKLALISLAGLNLMAVYFMERRQQGGRVSPMLRLAAVASIILWCAVLLCGRLIGFL
jgi:ABC-type transport system involved in cytochrome c biogenesis permease subunit